MNCPLCGGNTVRLGNKETREETRWCQGCGLKGARGEWQFMRASGGMCDQAESRPALGVAADNRCDTDGGDAMTNQ